LIEYLHEKNGITEVSKNLAKYISKNNFAGNNFPWLGSK